MCRVECLYIYNAKSSLMRYAKFFMPIDLKLTSRGDQSLIRGKLVKIIL